ncbi:MAG: SH3 domain-containing protein [Planctomycetota bacterium]
MRLCIAAIVLACATLADVAQAERAFPYTAYVSSDGVYVRSGPGKNYYPTDKLQTGDRVEVYRHDPGGWYAIRPPKESFSWVSGRYLDVAEDGLATVTGDTVASRVGSRFSDIRDVVSVRLHRGEVVEVLGKKEFGADPGSGTWYKIAPPSGEFRWVFGKFVDPDYLQSGVRKAPLRVSPMVQEAPTVPRARRAAATSAHHVSGESAEKAQDAEHWPTTDPDRERRPRQNAASDPSFEARREAPEADVRHTNAFVEPARAPEGTATLRRISPEEFQTELDEISMELSIMLVEEPTVWDLGELSARAQSLLPEAETALERGRARLLITRIDQSEDLRRRYHAVHDVHAVTERHNRQLAGLSRHRGASAGSVAEGRFDGTGRLVRVDPAKLGAPRFALLDENRNVRCYVSPAPGVNMGHLVGRRIGVNGVGGYIPEKHARHVAAKQITVLDQTRLR